MAAPPQRQKEPEVNELGRLYRAAEKLMLGETVKCRRCLGPLRFDEEVPGQIGIVCDTGCTRFYLEVDKKGRK